MAWQPPPFLNPAMMPWQPAGVARGPAQMLPPEPEDPLLAAFEQFANEDEAESHLKPLRAAAGRSNRAPGASGQWPDTNWDPISRTRQTLAPAAAAEQAARQAERLREVGRLAERQRKQAAPGAPVKRARTGTSGAGRGSQRFPGPPGGPTYAASGAGLATGAAEPGGAAAGSMASLSTRHRAVLRDRLSRLDPFWRHSSLIQGDPYGCLGAVLLPPCGTGATVGCNLNCSLSKDMLRRISAGQAFLQLVCFSVGDALACRCQWPLRPSLSVNGIQISPTGSKLHKEPLKATQADPPLDIGRFAMSSLTVRLLGTSDTEGFLLAVRLMERRSCEEVLPLLPPATGLDEALEEIKAKLCEDEDEDFESTSTVLSLKCPLSGSRISHPVRFKEVEGLVVFDRDTFLQVASRSGKWQCPVSMRVCSYKTLVAEPYVGAILQATASAGLKVDEVEVGPDARWRPRGCANPDLWFDVRHYDLGELQQAFDNSSPAAGGGSGAGGAGGEEAAGFEVSCVVLDEDEELREVVQPAAAGQGQSGGGSAAEGAAGGEGDGAVGGRREADGVIDLTLTDSEEGSHSAAAAAAAGSKRKRKARPQRDPGDWVGQKRPRTAAAAAAPRAADMETEVIVIDD